MPKDIFENVFNDVVVCGFEELYKNENLNFDGYSPETLQKLEIFMKDVEEVSTLK